MKNPSQRNRTLACHKEEMDRLSANICYVDHPVSVKDIVEKVICGDTFAVAEKLPRGFVDLLILDPPYNLDKDYNGHVFKEKEQTAYRQWFRRAVEAVVPTLKPTATVYVCADWKTSVLIAPVLEAYFHVRNRITWERDKGRGAKSNWKNNTEDVWFCTVSDDYDFDVEAVKVQRRVMAPYRVAGKPKDWHEAESGNYRLTHPSNIWTDLTIPFWSMPENTNHPTQKPEKLLAKLVLASSKPYGFVFDPFLGSGTTVAVAAKLGRNFCGIELNKEYCCWALKRLEMAASDATIQGYADRVFRERNAFKSQPVSTSQSFKQAELTL